LEPLQIHRGDRDRERSGCGGLTTGARKTRDRTRNCLARCWPSARANDVAAGPPRVAAPLHSAPAL